MLNLNSKRAGPSTAPRPPDSHEHQIQSQHDKLAESGGMHKRARTEMGKQSMQRVEYAQPPILAAMSADSARAAAAASAATSSSPPHHSPRQSHMHVAPFHSSPLTGAAIHSPRRAIVCASLEHAALCSSLLTQSSIHPAILQSLSVRLQALNDKDAEVVLARLTTLAKHLEEQTQAQKAARAAQIKHVQSQTLQHSPPQTNQQRNSTHACTTSPPRSIGSSASSGFPPPSPMPALSSSSSVSTDSTSRTTSPTISPAVGAMSPPQHASSSPQHFALQQGGATQTKPQQISAAPRTPPQTASTHPPLHPGSGSGGSGGGGSHYPQQLLLHSNGQSRSQQHHHQPPLHPQQPQQQAQLLHQSHAHAHSPLPLTTSMAPSSTSTSSAASSSSQASSLAAAVSSAALPQLDSSVAPSVSRSHSEDSDIPLGLMLLIEALPGSNVGPLTSAGDLANTTSPKVAQRSLKQTPEMPSAAPTSIAPPASKAAAVTGATVAASSASTTSALSTTGLSGDGLLPPPSSRKRSSSF